MGKGKLIAACVCALCVITTVATASVPVVPMGGPLNLTQAPPDVLSSYITLAFDGTAFTASGEATALNTIHAIDFGAFNIDLTKISGDPSGPAWDASGTLTITGGISDMGIPTGSTLFSGNIAAAGFNPTGSILEFRFARTGGELTNLGPEVGVILDPGETITFEDGFDFASLGTSTSGNGVADTFALVPEPVLGIPLLAGLLLLQRRRVRSGR